MPANPNHIISRFSQLKNETERRNFETIWENGADFCSPPQNNILTVRTAGERKPSQRLIDIGIRSNRIFTSGLSSHLIPAGAKFFNYSSSDYRLKDDDAVKRYYNQVTGITYEILNASNFFQEVTKSISHLGFIGTCCTFIEPASQKGKYINFKSHYINSYYISEDAYGQVDTVYIELDLTARQVVQLFGDNASKRTKDLADNPSTADQKVKIIHAIEPRADYNPKKSTGDERPIKSCYVEVEAKKVVKETGYYELPFAIGRFYQATNEKYGRCPALECLSTLSTTNAMELTRLNTAQRVANPPWLAPNDGSVRTISNHAGTIMYWMLEIQHPNLNS